MAVVATGIDERLLIGGEWVEAAGGTRFDVTDPATGEIVGSAANAGEADVALRSTPPLQRSTGGRPALRSSEGASCGQLPSSSASARPRSPRS